MFRVLKALLAPRSRKQVPIFQTEEPTQDEERIAISASVSFDAEEFRRRTSYHVRHDRYFVQAMIHRSFLQMCPPGFTRSNERLEFLGDAILNFVVAEYLYEHFQDLEEGELSRLRSRIVSRGALAESARQLHIEDFLLMSPSAHQSIQSGSDSILSDAFEAVIAAIYLDSGYKSARTFITEHLTERFSSADITRDENYKSALLEFVQAHALGLPRYVTTNESGPDHSPVFTVEVQVRGIPVGSGQGGNKKAAEQAAAARALEYFSQHAPEELQ